MEPEPDRIDFSSLDPTANPRWDGAIASVVARGRAQRRLRKAVLRRGAIAVVLAAAAGITVWLSAPRTDPAPPPSHADILDWAVGNVSPSAVLDLGGDHAR